jgi:deoxyribose-phosphate aldolase
MTDAIKTSTYVAFQNPLRTVMHSQRTIALLNCICARPQLTEPIGVSVSGGLRDWVQSKQVPRLDAGRCAIASRFQRQPLRALESFVRGLYTACYLTALPRRVLLMGQQVR